MSRSLDGADNSSLASDPRKGQEAVDECERRELESRADDRAPGGETSFVPGVKPHLRTRSGYRCTRRRATKSMIFARVSSRTGVTYFYGDFRRFKDVGGRFEALREEGEANATSDSSSAEQLYAARLTHYLHLRAASRSQLTMRLPAALQASSTGSIEEGAHPTEAIEMRLEEMIDIHLARKSASRAGRRPRTLRRDRDAFRHLQGFFGNCRLSEIIVERLDHYVARREREPGARRGTTVSMSCIRTELHSLSNMFRRAVSLGYASYNPVSRMMDKPRAPDREREVLTFAEVARLLDAARAEDVDARIAAAARDIDEAARLYGDARRSGIARALRVEARRLRSSIQRRPNGGLLYSWMEVLIATFVYTGGRISEVLGLLVSDIDFERKRVYFRANDYRVLKRDQHRREVELWPPLENQLIDYLAATGIRSGLLFPGKKGGMPSGFWKQLARCCRRAEFPETRRISPHTLRHTYATALLQTLVPVAAGQFAVRSSFEVAKRLGHRTSMLVDTIYGHLLREPSYMQTLSYESLRASPQ